MYDDLNFVLSSRYIYLLNLLNLPEQAVFFFNLSLLRVVHLKFDIDLFSNLKEIKVYTP